jgi:hypothetical protein
MGMFDNIKCYYPLPEATARIQKDIFQTKSFGDGFTGGFMDDYTITAEGELIFHKKAYEVVPDKDRPFYGTPEWDMNPLMQICGAMRAISLGDEVKNHHGVINIYTSDPVTEEWFEYEIKFTDGKVAGVKRIFREFGV